MFFCPHNAMQRVNFNAKTEEEFRSNLRLVQRALKAGDFKKVLPTRVDCVLIWRVALLGALAVSTGN